MKMKLVGALALFAIMAPYLAFAAINSNVWSPAILKGPLVTCTGAGGGGTSSCSNLCDLVSTAANVIYFGIGVVIWIIAPIMIAWSGIRLLISRGSPEKTSEARKMITSVVIGLLIVLCAYIIVYTFVHVLGIIGIGGFGGPNCTVQ
ncbi:MAG: hypothetical protein ABSE18_00485 [Minisyncoccia bacterium]